MKKMCLGYLRPYCLRMAFGFVIKLTGSMMDLFLPWTLAHMIDTVIPEQRADDIAKWGAFMLGCSVLALIFNIIPNRMASRVSSDIMYGVRRDLFAKVMYLTSHSASRLSRPSLISRLTSDTYNVHQMLARIQRLGVRAPILFIGGLIMTTLLDPALASIMLAMLPLLTVTVVAVSKKSIPMFASLQDSVDRFVRLIREDIAGIRVIKALSKGDYERARFDALSREVVEQERLATITTAITNPVMNMLLNIGLVLVIVLGAYRVNRGLSEVGRILAFMTYFTIILNALLSLSKMFIMVSKAAASARRIYLVFMAESEGQVAADWKQGSGMSPMSEGQAAVDWKQGGGMVLMSEGQVAVTEEEALVGQESGAGLQIGQGSGQDPQMGQGANLQPECWLGPPFPGEARSVPFHVEFKDVSFSYERVKNNLEHISFALRRGETLGIVGATGSGKSTVIGLLMRFYDVGAGAVLIDGTDVRSMGLHKLRRRFGAVFQNDTIFGDTILRNITMGRGLTEQEALDAARFARAEEFVAAKGGLVEQLDIRGANLSGGQKQRLLIARALAGCPEILVLDDSFSALDYKTDSALRREIREHFGGTTCVIVAQRISSVMGADHIMVLEKGRIIGYGIHEELLETCGAYREISELQLSG